MSGRLDDWPRVKEIFAAALNLPLEARTSYLAATCGGDDELRAKVQGLLESHERARSFLETPPQVSNDLKSSTLHLEGQRIGGYEVVARLGAGGMGEVYRARDLRLGRDVAIKILPEVFNRDPERLARFEREARVLAALTHPNIGAIYGVEDPAPGSGPLTTPALLLELIEGDTLAERIARSGRESGVGGQRGLPIAEALKVAAQIADALEAAHDKGIIHRDLKPANIKVTPTGVVKVLDFGLAKAALGDDAISPDLSHSPTMTGDGTRAGMILGTAAYMSPEQARGQIVDKRTDIWAFGCVLYEMLAGRAAFPGATVSDTIAAILEREPGWSALPSGTPESVRHLLRRCLEKDARQRLRDIGEARIELLSTAKLLEPGRPDQNTRAGPISSRFALWAAAAVLLAVAAAGIIVWTQRPVVPASVSIGPAGTLTQLTSDSGLTIDPALSPDGTLAAYASDRAGDGNLDIWIRQVAGGEPIRLTRHAADERTPSFSPDGTKIAFRSERDGGGVYLMPALGGEATLLVAGGFDPNFSPDGKWISYNTGLKAGDEGWGRLLVASAKLFVVPAGGGEARQLQPTAKSAVPVAWSPDSRHLLIVASFDGGDGRIDPTGWWVTPLEGTAVEVNRDPIEQRGLRLARPVGWLPGNLIVFAARSGDSRNHWTVRLSDGNWQITGAPEQLTSGAGIEGPAAVTAAGGTMRLAFSDIVRHTSLWAVSVPQDGLQPSAPVRLTQESTFDMHPTLSADDRTLIYSSLRRRQFELRVRDQSTGRDVTLLSSPLPGSGLLRPVISMDGSKLAFSRTPNGRGATEATIVVDLDRASDGTVRAGPWRELPSAAKEGSGWVWGWSPDGTQLWYNAGKWPQIENHLYDVVRGKRIAEFGHPTHDLGPVTFSPDRRWLAFWEPLDDGSGRLLVTRADAAGRPAAPQDWVEVAKGNTSTWSPMGDVMYYESDRDGWSCVWAQRLQRETMRAVGPPVAIHHAHSARLSIGNVGPVFRGLAVSRDRVVFSMSEMISNIWMTEFLGR
jgi:serine/threonine protein kinase/Tol biopolymer transport system component